MIGTTFPASMIGTTFPASIGTGTTGTSFPAVEARHDVPGVALDDRQQLPAVDHRQQDRGRCHPWPWMIGTTFPAVDRHGRHCCEPWPWMIDTGTSFPASIIGNRAGPRSQVDDRHHLPGCRSTRPARLGTTGTTAAVASRGPG
jgi:hypothetical protein